MNTTATKNPYAKIGKSRQVAIPKKIYDELGLKEGDLVEFTKKRRGMILSPRALIDIRFDRSPASRVIPNSSAISS